MIDGFEAGFWRPKNIRIRSRIHNTDIYDHNINLGTRMLALLRVERRQRLPAPRSRDSRSVWTISRLDPRVPYDTHCHSPDPVSRIRLRLICDWNVEGQGRIGGRTGIGAGTELGRGWNGCRDEIGAGMESGQEWNWGRDGMVAGIEWGQARNGGRDGMVAWMEWSRDGMAAWMEWSRDG